MHWSAKCFPRFSSSCAFTGSTTSSPVFFSPLAKNGIQEPPHCQSLRHSLASHNSRVYPAQGQWTFKADMKLGLATFVCFSFILLADSAPPTCYSRVLGLSKQIMHLLEILHNYHRTKPCVEFLPKMFLDVHNSCMMPKLRDTLYVLENLPSQRCRKLPRIVLLKHKVRNLYTIIHRVCYRDLVYLTDDCEAIETGHSAPRYGEDTLQILKER